MRSGGEGSQEVVVHVIPQRTNVNSFANVNEPPSSVLSNNLLVPQR